MKKLVAAVSFLVSITCYGILAGFGSDAKNRPAIKGENSFVVVELFTSEGCSSCPPADKLLGEIIEDARVNNKPIVALAFHVDYWNYLGWKDIYSDPRYSKRQEKYANLLDSHVYTPQMVINGKHQFVGSNSHKARSYIRRELSSSKNTIPFLIETKVDTNNHEMVIQYRFEELPSGTELQLALVEQNLVRYIKKGENRGRTLHHENVVRAFESIRPKETEGRSELKFSKDVKLENASLIAYLQDKSSGEILSARRSDF